MGFGVWGLGFGCIYGPEISSRFLRAGYNTNVWRWDGGGWEVVGWRASVLKNWVEILKFWVEVVCCGKFDDKKFGFGAGLRFSVVVSSMQHRPKPSITIPNTQHCNSNPKPQTPNPKPQTPKPKTQTWSSSSVVRGVRSSRSCHYNSLGSKP